MGHFVVSADYLGSEDSYPLNLPALTTLVQSSEFTMVGCACRVKLRITKGVVFFVPYRTAIRSGLTYIILGAIRTYLQYETIHHAWLVVFALWNRG